MRALPVQIFLILSLVVFGIYVLRVRSVLSDRLILFVLAICGVILILNPGLSTWVANAVGIGRGTDLILYLFIIFSLFRFAGIDANTRTTERQITEIVRTLALHNPQQGGKTDNRRDIDKKSNSRL
jgi:small membrane protein